MVKLIYPLTHNQNVNEFPRVTSNFGDYRGDGYYHEGIDWAAYTGQPIYAAGDGVVTNSIRYDLSGAYHPYGVYLWIDHGEGIWTAYCHLHRIYVKAGDRVTMGQEIAQANNTGNSRGSHLHFNVTVNKVYKNPLDYLTHQLPTQTLPPENTKTAKVLATAGLKVRQTPNGSLITTLAYQTIVAVGDETTTTNDGIRWIKLLDNQIYNGRQIGGAWIALDKTVKETYAIVQLPA